jgi:hypothetical protein
MAGVGDMKATVDGGSDREWGRDWWTSAGDGVRAAWRSAWETGAGGDCIAGTASCWATGGRLAGVSVNPSPNRRKALSSGGASESLGTGTGVMAAGGGAWDNDCIAARWAWACDIETRVAALSAGEGICDRGGGTVTAHVTTGTMANPSRMGQNAPSSSRSNDSSGRGGSRKSGTSVGSSEDGMTGATGVLVCDSGGIRGSGIGGTGIGDGRTGAVDTGRKDSGDVGTASDAGDRGPAVTSVGCKLTGEGIGDSWALSGGGHEAANTGCSGSTSGGGSASSWQSDEAGDRRGAAAGTCGGKAWAGDREAAAMASRKQASGAGDSGRVGIAGVIGTAGERGTSSAARDSVRVSAGHWGDEGETGAAVGREGGRAGSGGNEAAKGTDLLATSCCG